MTDEEIASEKLLAYSIFNDKHAKIRAVQEKLRATQNKARAAHSDGSSPKN
jgi:hypothetical protein